MRDKINGPESEIDKNRAKLKGYLQKTGEVLENFGEHKITPMDLIVIGGLVTLGYGIAVGVEQGKPGLSVAEVNRLGEKGLILTATGVVDLVASYAMLIVHSTKITALDKLYEPVHIKNNEVPQVSIGIEYLGEWFQKIAEKI